MNCKAARSLFFIPLNCISTVIPEPFTESLRPCLCVCVCVCAFVSFLMSGALKTTAAAGIFHQQCHFFLTWIDWKMTKKKKLRERTRWPVSGLFIDSECRCLCACVCVSEGDKEKELSVCVHDSRQTVVAWKGLGLTLWGLCVPWHPHNVNYYPWSGWAAVNAQEKIIPIHVLIHARPLDQM